MINFKKFSLVIFSTAYFFLFYSIYFFEFLNYTSLTILISIYILFLSMTQMYRLSYNGVFICFVIVYFIFIIFLLFFSYKIYNYNKIIIINLGSIVQLTNFFSFSFVLIFDYISITFCLLISLISFFVLLYLKSYFKFEPEINRFLILLVLFSISMLLLVTSGNFILFFFCWEMIGLSSFFLINFYYFKKNVWKSAFKAFYFNKISDSFILIGSILFIQNGVDFINIIPGNFRFNYFTFLALLFFLLGSSIKSSQLGFHVWLPDSMEAPVPASALIHSATLVSAGVYVLLRFYNFIIMYEILYSFLYIWFSLTALYGGLVAMYQHDIKKLLAYSTISHCGFLFVSTLNNNIEQTFIYLFLHGLFKAISFMMAGRFIQFLNTQDMRYWGGVNVVLPVDTSILFLSICNLAALPGSMGLYYKALFLTSMLNKYVGWLVLSINFIACLTGVGYTLHVFKAIYTRSSKLKILDCSLIKTLSGNIVSIFFIILILMYVFNLVYFNNFLTIEYIPKNNIFIIKLFYSFFLIYIFIFFSLDIIKKKNYFIIYYIAWVVLTCVIDWK